MDETTSLDVNRAPALTLDPSPKGRGKSKRRLFKLGLLLLAGAIINVAVAWLCIEMNDRWRTDLAILQATATIHGNSRPIAPPANSSSSSFAMLPGAPLPLGPVSERTRAWCYEVSLSGTSHACRASFRVGWPLLALETATFDGRIDQLQRRPIAGVADMFRQAIWPGFAINTIFYAAMVWLLYFAAFRLRRWRRIKRGLCPACAYPVGASDVCTECGKTVAHRNDQQ